MKNTKFIFVTGGVLSGLGKGVSAASLGRLLKSRGYKVFAQKFDPYYNIDPGTMSPYQHGEVYVTVDGAETDLDLGHYERFIGEKLTKESNYVQGKLLQELLEEERQGKYGGKTIQVIPHVTDKIIHKIAKAGKKSQADFVITEIGGTVGDMESLPFISAISQFSRKYKNSSFFIHATFVPYLKSSDEFKSKPTQSSISILQSLGIFPNMILLRANKELPEDMVSKVAKKAYLDLKSCIPVPNADNIYKIPLHFEKHEMADTITKYFKLRKKPADLKDWKNYVSLIEKKKSHNLKIALVGKYVEYEDAYKSIIEALKISLNWNDANAKISWVSSSEITEKNVHSKLKNQDGVIVLPGFGKRGFLGKIILAEYTRDKDIPTFGICFGMQAMVITQARARGIKDATSSEVSKKGTFVIDLIRGKSMKDNFGGTLRLGESETKLKENSVVHKLYGTKSSFERHRHRYEINPEYIDLIEDNEFIFSGYSAKENFAEVCEMPSKKFYLGIQAHPEFNANPLEEHPLFRAFVKATIKNSK